MITIIPDIHGRVFWKKAVDSASKDDTIVFLGDYLDMYWVDSMDFKKSNPERVVLLLGNHDWVVFHRVCPEPVPRGNTISVSFPTQNL